MLSKKFLTTWIGIFVGILVTDFLIHGVLLKSAYQASAQLWRPEAEMQSYFSFMLLGQALVAWFFTWIFTQGYKGSGWIEGVRYGLVMAGFMAGHNFIMYAVTPWEMTLVFSWIAAFAVQATILGIIATWMWTGKWGFTKATA